MPHYKCAACRARVHVCATPTDLVGDLCPDCGSLLEPVVDLAELIGFRSIRSAENAAEPLRSTSHAQTADTADGFLTRRAAAIEHDRVEAERWLDERDPPGAAAVALPPPRTC